MAHLLMGHCKVAMHQMQDFTTRIQNWEQDLAGSPHAPEFHGVYLERENPSSVVIELRFSSSDQADACIADGQISRLRDQVYECTKLEPQAFIRYDLYYSADADGDRTIFGEAHHMPG